MQLVTFGIDSNMNLVIQFPVFIQPYMQKPLILYQLETDPSSYFRPKHQSPILHTFEDQKALYSFKLRNIHFTKTTRIKIM